MPHAWASLIGRGSELLAENPPRCHFVHHKLYMVEPGGQPWTVTRKVWDRSGCGRCCEIVKPATSRRALQHLSQNVGACRVRIRNASIYLRVQLLMDEWNDYYE
jgi:hypothetical protein